MPPLATVAWASAMQKNAPVVINMCKCQAHQQCCNQTTARPRKEKCKFQLGLTLLISHTMSWHRLPQTSEDCMFLTASSCLTLSPEWSPDAAVCGSCAHLRSLQRLRRSWKRDPLSILEEHGAAFVWNICVHYWGISIALQMAGQALAHIAPDGLTDFLT